MTEIEIEAEREKEKLIQLQQQEFLLLYRQSCARLQNEDPEGAAFMLNVGAEGGAEGREKDIVDEMAKVVYSKRYNDSTYQYR